MTVGEKLRKLRGEKTQAEVTSALGITLSSYSNYENDYRNPKDEIKKKIALYYKKSIEEIFFS